jgi:hypothetical protein
VKFFHFAQAWVRHRWWKFRGYKALVSDKIAAERFRECLECPHFQDGECLICGCLVQGKVMLASESCPRGWWMAVKIKKQDRRPQPGNYYK